MERETETPLGPYRVLDLTDVMGWLCARILGDMGAEVIKVERPGGDRGRNIGPFYRDTVDPQKSLNWFAFNANKKSITLDIETADGRQTFKNLVKTADFIIESFPPGYLAELGLDYAILSELNPRIILTSISPFGQTGSRKDYRSCDLVAQAMSGLMYLTGDPDRSPVRIQPPQAFVMAGGQAAVGSLIAHHNRAITGMGQHVDVSAQESLTTATAQAIPFWHLRHIKLRRSGHFRGGLSTDAVGRQIWHCKDGLITFFMQGGKGHVQSNQALADWIEEEGLSDDFLRGMDWEKFDMAKSTQAMHNALEKPIGRLFLAHTKAEIYDVAVKRGIILGPVHTPRDVLDDVQLNSRGFWTQVQHPDLGAAITYPDSFVRMSLTPCGIKQRAPLIGEHNREIYQMELSPTKKDVSASKSLPHLGSSSPTQSEQVSKRALEGLKVVDFSWLIVGPLTTKYLADHGATVVRVESGTRIDHVRLSAPYKDGITKLNTGGHFVFVNSNKYSLSLNLSRPEGLQLVKKLIAWGDVVIENFSSGTMRRLGLGYEDLVKIKPGIIMLQSSMMGQTGPRTRDRGNGVILTGLTGLTHLTGWPDREPVPPFGAYTDYIVPMLATSTLLSALEYRRRTGRGQCIDLSQYEASISLMATDLLDCSVNEREGNRLGNQCAYAAPHAAYRCRGDDRWCTVAAFSEGEWHAFCEAIGNPEWTRDYRFATLAGRKANEVELDRLVEGWTVNFSAEEVMEMMQGRGIAAGNVQTAEDLLKDVQLQARNFFWWLNHSELGLFPHAGQPFKLSRTPASAYRPSPRLGEHTAMVCREILDMSDEEFVTLLNDGVFE